MLPMSSLSPGLSAFPPSLAPGMQAAPQPMGFAGTGIPGLTGGYAYPPGSEMAGFLDNLNGTVAAATRNPDGSSVIAWANGLAQQQAMRQQAAQQQAQAAAAQAASSGGSDLMQMLQTLLSALMSQLSARQAAA